MKRSIKPLLVAPISIAAVLGLSMPAMADNAPSAQFQVSAATTQSGTATATAAAYNGVSVTGKVFLQEFSTADSHEAIRNLKLPTKAEAHKYGIIVHSMAEGQAKSAAAVKHYNKLVAKAKQKVQKLQFELKHAQTGKQQLKHELKKAKKHLHEVNTSYKFIPILLLAHGVDYKNSGYLRNHTVQPYSDVVNGDQKYVYVVYVPSVPAFVKAETEYNNGQVEEDCHNGVDFVLPPGIPSYLDIILVKDLLNIDLSVTEQLSFTTYIVESGSLDCGNGHVVTDSKPFSFGGTTAPETKTYSQEQYNQKYGSSTSTPVQISDSLSATLTGQVESAHSKEMQDALTLQCPDQGSTTADTINDLYQGEHSANWKVYTAKAAQGYSLRFRTTYGAIYTGVGGTRITTYPVTAGNNTYTFAYYAPNDPGTTTDLTENIYVDLLDASGNVVNTYTVKPFTIHPESGYTD